MAITTKVTPAATPTPTANANLAWAKSGSSAHAEMAKYEKEVAISQEQNKKMWRFWVPEGEEARITFVDGNISADGNIDFFMFYEHNLMLNGKWGNTFVCTKDIEPCPICAAGDKPSFVGVFTVIDHREFKAKDGKIYKDSPRLFVAKKDTIKMLQNLGVKRGGLAGCTFDVVRTGEKSASVGSMFDFQEKNKLEDLQAKYQRKNADGKMETFFVPADYYKECQYRTAAELKEAIPSLTTGGSAPVGSVSAAEMADLDKEL